MPPVKDLTRVSDKWANKSAVSQGEYQEGVNNPRVSWAEATKAAESNYEQGVQRAIQRKAFGAGVTKAGDSKWQSRAATVGPSRWADGIQQSRGAYERGFAPYAEVIKRTQLPPRGPKGDPKNIQRVSAIAQALHEEKIKRTGGN